MTLGSAVYHAVSAQNGVPVMGCVQNTLTMAGVCTNTFDSPRQAGDEPTTLLPNGEPGYEILISRGTVQDSWVKAGFSSEEIRNYLVRLARVYPEYVEDITKGKGPVRKYRLAEKVIGKVVYSITLPSDLRWKKATKTNKFLPEIVIRDGIIMPESAPLCKAAIGATGGSLLHLEWRRHPRLNEILINRLVTISSVLNFPVGFSFSFGDCQAQEKVARDIKIAVEEANLNVRTIIQKNLDPDDEEKEINGAYNRIREIAPTIGNNMTKGMHSSLSILTTFGIKGNLNNVTQTAGITGQQNLSAKRIPWAITNKTRMTAHFLPNDKSPMAKGLISSNYLGGLNYKESMAAAVAGREGVVATGTKTADSGYAQKKLSKFVSDIRAHGDGTLRNAQGRIITTIYGGDGVSPKMKMMSHSLENGIITGAKFMTFVKIDHLVLTLESRYEASLGNSKPSPKVLITLEQAEAVASGLECGAPGYQTKVTRKATENLRKGIVSALVTIRTYQEILLDLAGELIEEFERAKVYDGYPAGLVACLSIGEIGTQLTLNTFHSTGIGDKSSSAGIARYNETLNVTAKPKNPGMTIYLRDPGLNEAYSITEEDPEKGKLLGLQRTTILAASFRYCDVEGMLLGPPILLRVGEYDPDKESPLSFEGAYELFEEPEWMTFLTRENPVDLEQTEWVIRIRLDSFKLYEASLTPFDVAEIIETFYETSTPSRSVRCVPSPTMLGEVLIFLNPDDVGGYAREKVYYPEGMVEEDTLYTSQNIAFFATREITKSIITVPLSGIYGITKAIPRLEGKEWVIDTQGTNLVEVLSDPLVDATRTISDHFREMEAVLGIEAGRAYLEAELKRVVKFDGAEVDDCHFSVVADAMSFAGVLTPISRHGISRDVGPISKLMFERPVVEAANAVIYGDIDPLKTIDAAVYVGQAPKLGTGVVKVVSGEIARSSIVPGGNRGYRKEADVGTRVPRVPRSVKAR